MKKIGWPKLPLFKPLVTLRAKLVLLVFAAIIPLLAMALFNAWRNADAALSRATDQLRFSASLVAANQLRVSESARQTLTSIAHVPGLLEKTPQACHEYLKVLRQQLPMYLNLGLIGLDGKLLCSSMGGTDGTDVGDRDYFIQTKAGEAFAVGSYTQGRLTGKPVLPFSVPMLDAQGKVLAVVFLSLDLNELSQSFLMADLPPTSRVMVMDRQGVILAVSSGASSSVGQKIVHPMFKKAVQGMRAGVAEVQDVAGVQHIVAFNPVGTTGKAGLFVTVSASREEVLDSVQTQLYKVLMVLSMVALLGGLIAWRMASRAVVEPTAKILDAIRSLGDNQLDTRLAPALIHEGGEMATLASGINQMAQALQQNREALEQELQRSQKVQQQLQEAQRLAHIAYWQVNLDTGQVWWSDEVNEVLGVDHRLVSNRLSRILRFIHPTDRQKFRQARLRAFKAHEVLDIELRISEPTGKTRWVHVCSRIDTANVQAPAGERSGTVQDITQRKLAELTILHNQDLLNRTGSLARIGGWELTPDPLTLTWSDQTYRIHGMAPGAPVELHEALAHYDSVAQATLRAAIAAAFERGTAWDLELPMTSHDGQSRWVRTQGQALLHGGKTVRVVGALHDITEQHQAQELLRLLETCISRLNDMVIITDAGSPDGSSKRIVFVNEAFAKRTGYTRQEALGQSPRFLDGPKTQRSELERIRTAVHGGHAIRVELINYTKAGAEFWVDRDMVPIADAEGKLTHWVAVARDITDKKRSEQALRESEQRYAALFDNAPISMWVFDLQTLKFLAVNKAAQACYGYSQEEFLSMSVLDIRPQEEWGRMSADLSSDQTSPDRGTWQHRRRDGSLFFADIVSQQLQHAGRSTRFIVAMDVSARIKAEKDAQEYLYTLQRAADAAQAITWHQTLEGTVQEIVEQARGVVGAHQAWLNLGTRPLSDSPDSPRYAVSLSEKYGQQAPSCPADGGVLGELVAQTNRPLLLDCAALQAHPCGPGGAEDGGQAPAPLRGWLGVPLTDRNGRTMGVLQLSDKYEGEFTQQDQYVAIELAHLASAAVENTRLLQEIGQLNASLEQKVVERTAALAHQEALFRAVAEQAPEVIWTADAVGGVRFVNQTWLALIGGEHDDWTGNQWTKVVHPDDLPEVMANWQASQTAQQPFAGTRRVRAADGSWHTMSYRGSPVLAEDGTISFWVGIDTDISEIKAIEDALRLSNRELEAFSYSVSHDLRSPLNTVDGFSRLLAKQLDDKAAHPADEKIRHYLARIQAGVGQMGQLIEDLLSLAQVTRVELRREPVDLSALARDILQERLSLDPTRQIVTSVEDGLQALGDSRLIKVMLENLLGNAWKFTAHQLYPEIHVGQIIHEGGACVFFVRDNGVGFDMAYAHKLFAPFQRLHAVKEFEGTGIGLATCSRVVERHGGRIWVQAAADQGASFFFTLPRLAHARSDNET